MGILAAIGRVITRRLNRAARKALPEDQKVELFLPRTAAEQERWEQALGVKPDQFRGKLIALAAEARHRDRTYREKRSRAGQKPKRKRVRNRPHALGMRRMRRRKRALRKRGR